MKSSCFERKPLSSDPSLRLLGPEWSPESLPPAFGVGPFLAKQS